MACGPERDREVSGHLSETTLQLTREQRRSRRPREVRSRTISVKRLPKWQLERGRLLYPESTRDARPKTRGECVEGERPCPFVSCAHNLYLDVSRRTGAIKLNFPDLEPEEMRDSCALDVADRGGETLEGVGAVMNMTRERVRQVEVRALSELLTKHGIDLGEIAGVDDRTQIGKRKLHVISTRELDADLAAERLRLADEDEADGDVDDVA